MEKKDILIPVRLNIAEFEAFARFDLSRRGVVRRMALYTCIFGVSAWVCFVFDNGQNHGVLFGWVLLMAGLAMPTVYLSHFFKDVRKQARQLGLEKPTLVYTVSLTGQEVEFRPALPGQQGRTTPWAEVFGAWRTKRAVYLYTVPGTAYLLPNGQAKDATDEQLWAFISSHLAPEKLHG